MKQKSSFAFTASLGLVAATLGCEATTPVGKAGAPESYVAHTIAKTRLPQTPRSASDEGTLSQPESPAQVIVRSVDRHISHIAATDDQLYFVGWWDGLYRTPTLGGVVEVVEASAESQFGPLATSQNQIFWVRTRFDAGDFPSTEVKRAGPSGAATLVFAGDWGIATSNHTSTFQADATGVYAIAAPAGAVSVHLQHIAATGGSISRAMEIDQNWPSWLRDDGKIFFTDCANKNACELQILADGSPAPAVMATLAPNTRVTASDGEFLFVHNSKAIWRVNKADGAITEVTAGMTGTFVGASLLVDGQFIYYTTWSEDRSELLAWSRSNGTTETLCDDSTIRGMQQIAQNSQFVYILHDEGSTISAVAKPSVN